MTTVPLISIIDDDASVRSAIEDLACSLGFAARAFASAQDFLQSPHVGDTSCLITDVQMPGMNGLELQSELLARGHRMPIIFITAFPEKTVQARAEAAGAVAFLEKPFDGCNLAGLISEVMADRG